MRKVFSKFSKGLAKTRAGLVDGISNVVKGRRVDEQMLDDLEELLILSDVGYETAERIIDELREQAQKQGAVTDTEVIDLLKRDLLSVFEQATDVRPLAMDSTPFVMSIVGVNGTGKTTTIGKLAHRYREQGKKVLLAAADTFRAAAGDQLSIWADRADVDIVHHEPGSDPASVAFDALKAAMARRVDVLLIDTAGRLHTKTNLMAELTKIHTVLQKQMPDAPHEVLLVLDATTGQNGLAQAQKFAQAVKVSGLILTKLDGTAKGGIVFSIVKELQLPVRYVGVGEKLEDLEEFDPKLFIEALFQ